MSPKPHPSRGLPSILDVLQDKNLFGPLFETATWQAWRAFLIAVFGLLAGEAEIALIRRCTGRQVVPTAQAREAWVVVGRRGGKSRIAALLAVFLACFRDYRRYLAHGERGIVMLIASDRSQARVLKGYIGGFLRAVPMLEALIANETAESIELTNGIAIEVHTASFRAVRGYTVVAALLDEIAFWPTDDAANPDTEILTALRPAMSTIPGALLIGISSPYARRGELWKAYRDHFGKDDDPVLVWQADTQTMNPTVPQDVIQTALAEDPARAEAEYGAQFRRDIEAFVSLEILEAARVSGRQELPKVSSVRYVAFVDPSGGSADSMTLAIAHAEGQQVILDVLREAAAPFAPDAVVQEFAGIVKVYGLSRVTGDRYAGEWPADRFRTHGISYEPCEKPKSDLYRDFLPALNSRQVELLDHPKLFVQLPRLERRTGRGGKDTIDHPPGGRDDLANAAAGAVVLAREASQHRAELWFQSQGGPEERPVMSDTQQIQARLGSLLVAPQSGFTCGGCRSFQEASGRCEARRFQVQASMPGCELYDVKPPADVSR